MKEPNILRSKLSKKCLIYGSFAVICNLFAILLTVCTDTSPAYILVRKYAAWIEYPVMAFTVFLAGAMLFDYIEKEAQNKK